ncbi:MAG: hypothetical protein HY651_11280 [Acidobacteria bacterium]|nr:hypothetical protein [Acidobacteriota bacterium]
MSDRVYLSLWVNEFSSETMLATWAKALAVFPVSTLAPGIRELAVYPLEWVETPVLEQSFQQGAALAEVVALAAEFLHEDYAYEVELNWDVWLPREPGSLDQWERVPQMVSVACLGPQFEYEDAEDHPHLLVSLGLDSILLPDGVPDSVDDAVPDAVNEEADQQSLEAALEGVAGNCYRENIAQLLGYMRKLEENLAIARRLLWSSSGEDFASRIRSAYGQ